MAANVGSRKLVRASEVGVQVATRRQGSATGGASGSTRIKLSAIDGGIGPALDPGDANDHARDSHDAR